MGVFLDRLSNMSLIFLATAASLVYPQQESHVVHNSLIYIHTHTHRHTNPPSVGRIVPYSSTINFTACSLAQTSVVAGRYGSFSLSLEAEWKSTRL